MSNPSPRSPEPRPRLGRGLAALLGDAATASETVDRDGGVRQVPIEFVRSSVKNPRQAFNETELEELAASIKERGIIQPIVVRPSPHAEGAFEIIAGERRWRAAQRVGLHSVPVISIQVTDREALELSIIENIQRADLNALEEARGYAQLAAEYGYNHADIGRVVGKSRSHVANTLRLLGLSEHVRKLLVQGDLSAGHARALLSVENPDSVANKVIAEGLTVRDVEKLAGDEKPATKAARKRNSDPVVKDLENKLSLALGAKISIQNDDKSQFLRIGFKDVEQLNFICDKLLRE